MVGELVDIRKYVTVHSSNSIVQVLGLSHRYAKDWAVRDVSFKLTNGGIYGLLGANGAGKSTIMNVMCGVLFPTQGDVLVRGQSIRSAPIAAKTDIGFLPQQVPLYNEFTVSEYLRYCASLRNVRARRIRMAVEEAMERCGVQHFRHRLIGALSGGYRQRVGIAQAVLHKPALVVLDEPTNGLDPNQILAVRKLIKGIANDCTVILSTHILSEVEAICDYIKMIDEGKIVFEGSIVDYTNFVEPNSIIVDFAKSPDADELRKLPGVETSEALSGRKYRLRADSVAEVARAVVEASVARKWGLQEIYFERYTLEEVFARLSTS